MHGGIEEREVMDLPSEPLAFVLRRDGKLTKGPGVRFAKERDLGPRLRRSESHCSDDRSIQLCDKASTGCKAFGRVFYGLMSCPIAQTTCCMRGIR